MNIYRINVEHAAPKANWTNIECFLLAEDDESVYQWIDKKCHGCWSHVDEEGDTYEIYDEDYNVIGKESYREKILRLKGEINDDSRDYADAYYGLEFFGWELVEFPSVFQATVVLEAAGILQRVTPKDSE